MAYLLSDTIFNGMKRNRVIQSFILQMPKTTSYTEYVQPVQIYARRFLDRAYSSSAISISGGSPFKYIIYPLFVQ
jgi:hypothetical protein